MRMEISDGAKHVSLPTDLGHPSQGEYPLDEILPEDRIVEPSIFFDGYQGEMFHKNESEYPHADLGWHTLAFVNLDPFHTAGM